MKFTAAIRLLLTFYKNFFVFNFLVTLACAVLFREYGLSILKVICWFKIATQSLTWYFIRTYKQKEFYYYRNLGIRDALLWSITLSIDLCLYILLLFLTHLLQP